jgi:hypothetical protein
LPAYDTTLSDWLARHPTSHILARQKGTRTTYPRDFFKQYKATERLAHKVNHEAPATYPLKSRVLGILLDDHAVAYPFVELQSFNASIFDQQVAGHRFRVHWDPRARRAHVTDLIGRPIVSTAVYCFAWYAFHPTTGVFLDGEMTNPERPPATAFDDARTVPDT